MLNELKAKARICHSSAKIYKSEEQHLKKMIRLMRDNNHEYLLLDNTRNRINRKRTVDNRREARAVNLAMGIIKQLPYKKVENNEPLKKINIGSWWNPFSKLMVSKEGTNNTRVMTIQDVHNVLVDCGYYKISHDDIRRWLDK